MEKLIAEYNEAIGRLGRRIDELSDEPLRNRRRIDFLAKERYEMILAVNAMREYGPDAKRRYGPQTRPYGW